MKPKPSQERSRVQLEKPGTSHSVLQDTALAKVDDFNFCIANEIASVVGTEINGSMRENVSFSGDLKEKNCMGH